MRKEEVLTKEELKFLTTAPAKAKAVMYFDHLANVTTGGEPLFEPEEIAIVIDSLLPVSYTHLTLPTSDLV